MPNINKITLDTYFFLNFLKFDPFSWSRFFWINIIIEIVNILDYSYIYIYIVEITNQFKLIGTHNMIFHHSPFNEGTSDEKHNHVLTY